MYIIWLILMAVIIAYVAVPFAREMGYTYGRFNRLTDMMIVLAGTVIFTLILTGVFSVIGASTGGTLGALVMGFIGAILMVGVLTVFSTKETLDEDELQETPDQET